MNPSRSTKKENGTIVINSKALQYCIFHILVIRKNTEVKLLRSIGWGSPVHSSLTTLSVSLSVPCHLLSLPYQSLSLPSPSPFPSIKPSFFYSNTLFVFLQPFVVGVYQSASITRGYCRSAPICTKHELKT